MSADGSVTVTIASPERVERNARPPRSELWTMFELALKHAHPIGAMHHVACETGLDAGSTARQLVRSGRDIGAKIPPPIEDFAAGRTPKRPVKPSHSTNRTEGAQR